LKDENAFKTWIVRILMAKIKKKQKEYYRDDDTQDISEVEPEVRESNFDGVEILEVINELEENERLVLSLSIVGGYKSDEIAKMLGSKAATIRSQLSRAKLKLRDLLIAEQEGR
ncbi:MAG: sigma-70 family RNA polymerase sigma factor, partial [Oscillospiraceae bacterium]|nr:sigma-70 family RNA polymerase sigma factor [Oscillospiraceae bacterium]